MKSMDFSRGKDWLPLPPIFKGENVSFREAKSESQGVSSGKDWEVCTQDTQDFARLVRCSRKEPHV